MSLSRTTRKALGNITQSAFASFLAERTSGRLMPQSQISRYDTGVNAMNKAQIEICAPIAANWLAVETRSMPVDQAAKLILAALK